LKKKSKVQEVNESGDKMWETYSIVVRNEKKWGILPRVRINREKG